MNTKNMVAEKYYVAVVDLGGVKGCHFHAVVAVAGTGDIQGCKGTPFSN